MKKVTKRVILVAMLIGVMLSTVGCIKPYDTPEFVTISASQTAFLVPLIGDSSSQASFESEELLAQAKVATKEVQIPHRWVQMGRQSWVGEYRPAATLIVVERKPVSRSWNSGDTPETSVNAIWGGTNDGVGVYVGMSCSAQINEADATKFLYRFNNTSLESVIDNEIKSMVKEEFNKETRKYSSTELNKHKSAIVDAVKETVGKYFKEYGITITVLGTNEDFSYENKAIQEAIDNKFISEQKLVTQQNENAVAIAKAEADAEAAKIKAEAEAEVLRIAADAEAEANRKIAESLSPELIEMGWVEKWSGNLPIVSGDATPLIDMSKIMGE